MSTMSFCSAAIAALFFTSLIIGKPRIEHIGWSSGPEVACHRYAQSICCKPGKALACMAPISTGGDAGDRI
jgi:hypothetical protein